VRGRALRAGLSDFMLLAYTISNIFQRHKLRTKAGQGGKVGRV